MRVYVAAPYSEGVRWANVNIAIDAADALLDAGHCPYLTHLNHFWHLRHHHSWDDWMQTDLVWLEQCEVLVRLPGESKGADREVERARELGLPIYLGVEEFLAQSQAA